MHNDNNYTTDSSPFKAPAWTLSGSNGYLKNAVNKACQEWYQNTSYQNEDEELERRFNQQDESPEYSDSKNDN